MRFVTALSVFGLLLIVPERSTAQSVHDEPQCWSAKALSYKPSEHIVRRGGKQARIKIPQRQPRALPPIPPHLRGSIRHVKLPDGQKLMALTFDLCESSHEVAGYEGRIVDYLREHKIKATFFAGGHWMKTHKTRAMQLTADPLFEIGNHSWSHTNLRTASKTRLAKQINKPQTAYEDVREALEQQSCFSNNSERLNKIPRQMKLFRFPYGSCSPQALNAVAQSGLLAIQWNLATGDPAKGQSAKRIASTVLRRAKPGSIVIAHANGRGWHSAKALPLYIPKLQAKGYEFVTISELLAAGTPVISNKCFNERPGDTKFYEPQRAKQVAKRVSKRATKQVSKRVSKKRKKKQPPKSSVDWKTDLF